MRRISEDGVILNIIDDRGLVKVSDCTTLAVDASLSKKRGMVDRFCMLSRFSRKKQGEFHHPATTNA
jgi:hypothetical protein